MTLSDVQGSDVKVANYARRNTREDAVFLTPPQFGRFRLAARRAIVVDVKAFPFQDKAMVEWKERLLDCYGEVDTINSRTLRKMEKHYKSIDSASILSLRQKYGFTHAVLYKETSTELPVVFENSTFKVVAVQEDNK